MKVKANIKHKTHLIQLQLFNFDKPACLQKTFLGRTLSIQPRSQGPLSSSIQVFSADRYYLNNRVFLSKI